MLATAEDEILRGNYDPSDKFPEAVRIAATAGQEQICTINFAFLPEASTAAKHLGFLDVGSCSPAVRNTAKGEP